MAGDYIPASDAEFQTWQAAFVTYANANLANLGLVAGDMAPVTGGQTVWNTSYTAHQNAQNAAQAARQAKDLARTNYVAAMRTLVRRLQSSPDVSDAERASLGITVRDTTPSPVGAPATRPMASIDTAQRLRHIISFMDEATPTSKAKPAGVMGAEVWIKIGGAAPVDPSELTFLALDTRTPYTADFAGADGGKTAHYWLRWVSTRGDKEPWSETASASIGG